MNPEQDPQFDMVIGQLDFVLSKLMGYAKDAEKGTLSAPNRQTLKHHAEDMEAAAKAIYKRLGVGQEGTPQPEETPVHSVHVQKDSWAGLVAKMLTSSTSEVGK